MTFYQPKVAYFFRIKCIISPKPKKILQFLRLRELQNSVFIKINKVSWNIITWIKPNVSFGYPARDTISRLIYKRGYGENYRDRLTLTDNAIINPKIDNKES